MEIDVITIFQVYSRQTSKYIILGFVYFLVKICLIFIILDEIDIRK